MRIYRIKRLITLLGLVALLAAAASPSSVYHPIVTFNDSGSYDLGLARTGSAFLVSYRDGGDSLHGNARVGLVVNNIISFGPEATFNSANTGETAIAIVATNTFAVAYSDWGDSDKGKVVIGTLSGSTISFGSEYIFNNGATGSISIDQVLANKFVIAYKDDGDSSHGKAIVCTNSGTVVSCGSETTLNAATTTFISLEILKGASPAAFALAFRDFGDSHRGKAIIGEISGTTITFGCEYTFNTGISGHISVTALTDDKFAVAYRDESNMSYGTARIGTVSGTVITFGSEYVFKTGHTELEGNSGIARLSDTSFALAYIDDEDDGYSLVASVSGTTITFGSPQAYNPSTTSGIPVVDSLSGGYVVCWADGSGTQRGKCRVNGDALNFLPRVSK
ncbi:MAG: hypothetical protein JXB15_13950 [Anaerolineales bacterium]|nr:hypothetical protein [Anaerolineales bacterium]